jgi:hypothetical protein
MTETKTCPASLFGLPSMGFSKSPYLSALIDAIEVEKKSIINAIVDEKVIEVEKYGADLFLGMIKSKNKAKIDFVMTTSLKNYLHDYILFLFFNNSFELKA